MSRSNHHTPYYVGGILNDQGTGSLRFAGIGTAIVTLFGSGTGTLSFSGSGHSVQTFFPTGTGSMRFGAQGVDTTPGNGPFTGRVSVVRSGPVLRSPLVFSVSGSSSLTFNGSAVPTLILRTTGVGHLNFSGLGVGTFSASGTGTLTFAGSGHSVPSLFPTGTGNLTFNGSGHGVILISDSGSGSMGFRGSGTCSVIIPVVIGRRSASMTVQPALQGKEATGISGEWTPQTRVVEPAIDEDTL